MADPRTPIMNIRLPTPGSTKGFGVAPAGESWPELLAAAISVLDSHNHGSLGVPVPASGVNINADLPFGGNDATGLRSARFDSQGSALNGASDLRCVFAVADDLYYRDGAGNAVRLTSGGALAGTPGSISGLSGSAAAAWVSGSSTFELTSAAGIFAHLKAGNVLVTEPVSGGKSATLKAPTGLSANYQITLPGSLPASTRLLSLDAAGALAATAFDAANVARINEAQAWSAKPSFGAGAAATAGDLEFSASAIQAVVKRGSGVFRVSNEVGDVEVWASNTRRLILDAATGKLRGAVSPVAADSADHLATKGYADGIGIVASMSYVGGSIQAQKGPVTISLNSHTNGTGTYVWNVPGMTTSGIVLVAPFDASSDHTACVAAGTDTVTVKTKLGGTPTDHSHYLLVIKL